MALWIVAKKLELPAYAESFDRLYYGRDAGDQKFDVQEWANAPTNE